MTLIDSYITRKAGKSPEDCKNGAIQRLKEYINERERLITTSSESYDTSITKIKKIVQGRMGRKNNQMATLGDKLRTLYTQNDQDMVMERNLKETESQIIAAQINAIGTNHFKTKIDDTSV